MVMLTDSSIDERVTDLSFMLSGSVLGALTASYTLVISFSSYLYTSYKSL